MRKLKLNQFIAPSSKPWVLLDSNYNKENDGAVWLDRVKLEVNSAIDKDTDANVWRGYAQFTAGFNDWRAFAIGGISSGSSLGLNGTEEKWLKSLKGEQGTATEMRYNKALDQLEWKLKTESEWTGVLPLKVIRGTAFDEAVASIQASTADARKRKEAAADSATGAREEAIKAIQAKQGAESAREQTEDFKRQAEQIKNETEQVKSDVQSVKAETEQIKEQANVLKNQAASYKNDAEIAMARAQAAKGQAENQATQATLSADSAAEKAQAAEQSKSLSQSWAVGGTGQRPGENTNNAKYWSDRAKDAAGGGVVSFNGRSEAVVPDFPSARQFRIQHSKSATEPTTLRTG